MLALQVMGQIFLTISQQSSDGMNSAAKNDDIKYYMSSLGLLQVVTIVEMVIRILVQVVYYDIH